MRRWLRRLDARLFVSHAAVALIGAVTAAVVARVLAPGLFDDRVRGRGFGGPAAAGVEPARSALHDALDTALVVGVVVAFVAAGLAAVLVTRRLLLPLAAVQAATRRLASGQYEAHVPEPAELELAALAADVNRLGAALAATEQRRAQLMSDLAHELRTPLTTIQGFLEGLIDGVFEPTPEVLGDLSDEVARLERLAGDLGTLSRADEGALQLAWSDADVADLTRRVTDRLRPQFDDKGVELQLRAPDPVPARVDADRVVQLLTNLVGNALAYTAPQGSVTVTVAVAPVDHEVVVAVQDTGIGIAADELESVFERFHRGDRTGPGTGIGLTIARSIARAHGGEITAASPGRGAGATFTVRLPVAPWRQPTDADHPGP